MYFNESSIATELNTCTSTCNSDYRDYRMREGLLTGSTNPLKVISPVMAVSERTHLSVNSDTRTVVIVTPAEGPSLLTAPAGK